MWGAEEQQLGLAVELLTVILGLEEETLDRVIRVITDSQDVYDIKTDMILQRIGPRANRYLRNSIEIARHEGGETHEHGTEDEPDAWKDPDLDQTNFDERPPVDDVDIEPEIELKRESLMFTFKDFLEAEEIEDVEDLSSEDLNQRAAQMKKMAQLKASGRGDHAEKQALQNLQKQLRTAKDPRQKADLQRRIRELTTKDQNEMKM